jgi:oxaloacetate decarboxylase gamma subunit
MTLPLLAESFNLGDGAGVAVLGFVLVIAVLAVLALFVKGLSKVFSSKKGKKPEEKAVEPVAAETVEAAATAPTEEAQDKPKAIQLPYTPGYVTLDGVNEQDAAVIMAIISHKTGIPLERLCFKYISRLNQEPELVNIEEQDAAVIMAITANKLGVSLDNLIFNSIKLVEE